MLSKIPKYIRNKYTVTALAFIVWILFLDNFDVFTLMTNINQRDSKRTEQVRLQSEIDKTKRKLHELTSDPEQLEKFARENYLMKRENEDVFVIVVEE
jgi:cell division protein DivIC